MFCMVNDSKGTLQRLLTFHLIKPHNFFHGLDDRVVQSEQKANLQKDWVSSTTETNS